MDDDRRVSRKPWTRVTVRFSVIHPVARDFLLSNASASPSLSLPGDAAAQRGRVSPEGTGGLVHKDMEDTRPPAVTDRGASDRVGPGGVGGAEEARAPGSRRGAPRGAPGARPEAG